MLTLFTDLNGFLICLLIIVLRSTCLSLFIKRYSNKPNMDVQLHVNHNSE